MQVVWDPNVDNDIYSRSVPAGNDHGGIWSPYIVTPAGVAGSRTDIFEKPDEWTDGRIGVRLQALVGAGLASLNFLYGRDINPLYTATPGVPPIFYEVDGTRLVHLTYDAFFHIRKMIGGMYSRELGFIPRIGGISSPIFRLEWAYFWDSTFANLAGQLETHDDRRIAASLDFALPIRWLNPRQTFKINAQYYLRNISDMEGGWENRIVGTEGAGPFIQKYNQFSAFTVSTNYWASRLTPSLAWTHDWSNESYFVKPSIKYTPNAKWAYTLAAGFFGGNMLSRGLQIYSHKDFVSFKVQYKWG
ncbi:MAG: hypothetical protein HKP58_14120 [Desulfatitalea sp.]|nr:hypothetical protein [Desulfatitalea sp.]